MRNATIIILIYLLIHTLNLYAIDVNGKFLVNNPLNSEINVTLQINTNTGLDDLGGATIVIKFDTMAVNYSLCPTIGVDYFFCNFSGGNYNIATITHPVANEIWINIDLPPTNNNNGTIVSCFENWSDVVTLKFSIVNENYPLNLWWKTTSMFWQVYDADNITPWQNGVFENIFNYPLPVELSSFTAQITANDEVFLKWIIQASVNNYGFDIERNSTSDSSTWVNIGFVEGISNSTFPVEYNFTDRSYREGTKTNYRLKMIDNDGTYEYSNIVEVLTLPQSFSLEQNFPNPFNPSTKIRFSLPHSANIKLEVFNILGEKISDLIDAEMDAGNHEIEFSANNLASGLYIYRLSTKDFVDVKKMVVAK